jgi:Rad3-related DNA helicase
MAVEGGMIYTPGDYGLPYDTFWPGQQEAIDEVTNLLRDNSMVFLLADTGTGKSGIAKAVSDHHSTATMLTRTISLEEQYGELLGLEIGRGRRWHRCWRGIDALSCMKQELCEGPCEYRAHINRLRGQKIRVLNYAQFFALNSTNHGFKTQLVVCDEAHSVESTLQSFVDLWFGEGKSTWGFEYKHLLLSHGAKFLMMSASMIPALVAETMGIEDYVVYEAGNDFDPARNPVFVKPVGYITAQRPLVDRLVRWIDTHLDSTLLNGVIHTSSDRQTEDILSATKHRSRFIWPKGASRAAEFSRFKRAGANAGAVLISASSYEGQDFPGDECRWQVVCKVPYASLGDQRVRARREQRPDIYRLEALQRIQQAAGRGMRRPDDWCVTYVLDATVIGLYEKHGWQLSRKFQQQWKGVI